MCQGKIATHWQNVSQTVSEFLSAPHEGCLHHSKEPDQHLEKADLNLNPHQHLNLNPVRPRLNLKPGTGSKNNNYCIQSSSKRNYLIH